MLTKHTLQPASLSDTKHGTHRGPVTLQLGYLCTSPIPFRHPTLTCHTHFSAPSLPGLLPLLPTLQLMAHRRGRSTLGAPSAAP
jgi:hypothetical protein